jgi:hydroxyethylthiazole kinase-like uncharacterized protein yjeF
MSGLEKVTPETLRGLPLPALPKESDKNARGRVLVVGGGAEVPGAALLVAHAALRAGTGKLQIAAPRAYAAALGIAMPEARVIPVAASRSGEISARADLGQAAGDADAVVIGPGMLNGDDASALTARLASVEGGAAFLVDAAALTGLAGGADISPLAGRLILTPHAGEMARLLGVEAEAVRADPLDAARRAAARWNAVVVMKGVETRIVTPDGRAWLHEGGCHGLGVSGSGDVLAGVIGGLLARGAPPATAAVWGVWLHGAAGEALSRKVGRLGFLARELPGEIPGLLDVVAGDADRRSDG